MIASDTSADGAVRIAQLVAEAEAARRRGNWREAAGWYLDAASVPDARLSPSDRIRHRFAMTLRAADCHIRGGALGHGWALLRPLLEQTDVEVPSSATGALIGATWRRGQFMLRERAGLGLRDPSRLSERSLLRDLFRVREAGSQPRLPTPTDSLRMLVLDEAARSLTLVNTGLADALRTRHLADAERFGASSDRCRALANEIAMQTRIGAPFDKSVKRLLDSCAALAAETGEPLDEAWLQLARATYEFSHGRWRHCVEACVEANRIFAMLADEGLDITHERARVAALHWFALAWLGELAGLRALLDQAILEAERHKDSLMLLEALTGQPMLVWLAADEVALVRERAAELLERHRGMLSAAWPENAFRRQQYRDLMAEVHAALYGGDATGAWAALMTAWPELESAFYLPMRTIGLELRSARARVALALAEQLDRDGELTRARLQAQPALASASWDRARLLLDVKATIDLIRRESNCCAPALTSLLQAGVHNLEGRREDAMILLDAAVREFNSVDMALHRECARYALGELTSGSEGGGLQDQAETWMRRQKVLVPRRLAASQAPGLGL